MKTLQLFWIFVLFVLCYSPLQSQKANCTDNIVFDFETKKFLNSDKCLNKLRKGDRFNVVVDNINMNLFKVSINKKDSSTSSSVEFPTLSMIGLDPITSLASSLTNSTSSSAKSAKIVSDIESLVNTLADKKETLSKVDAELKVMISSNEFMKLENNGFSYKSIESKYPAQKSKLDEKYKLHNQITEINKSLSSLNTSLKIAKVEDKILQELDARIEKMKNNTSIIKTDVTTASSNLTNLQSQSISHYASQGSLDTSYEVKAPITLKKALDNSTKVTSNLNSIKNDLQTIKKDYLAFKEGVIKSDSSNRSFYRKNAEIKEKDELLLTSIDKSIKEIETTVEKFSNEKIIAFFKDLIHLQNKSTRAYTSMPFVMYGDMNKIKISITPADEKLGYSSYEAEYEFPAKRFYVGIGGSFFGAWFRDDAYSIMETKTSDTTSVFNLIDEEVKRGEYGIAALLHFGGKIAPDKLRNILGVHGTIGPGVSIKSKPQIRLMVGAGISIGKDNNMFTIDGLKTVGYVDRLSKAFDLETDYAAKPENVTVSRLSHSWALSLGYIYKF